MLLEIEKIPHFTHKCGIFTMSDYQSSNQISDIKERKNKEIASDF